MSLLTVSTFSPKASLRNVAWTAAGQRSSANVLVVDGQVHLGESAVLKRSQFIRFAADVNLCPVNRLVILIFFLGDRLDLRSLRFRL